MNRSKRIAVIDLGTNTFHLIISEITYTGNTIPEQNILFKKKIYVKLASGGISTIETAAWQRGITTLSEYKEIMDSYDVLEVYAFGTAGLRTASNGKDFVAKVKTEIGIDIQLINGEKEAELIWRGVQQAVQITTKPTLIIDIGGGSVEFIIANTKELLWKKSFPIGAAVLRNIYHKQEPMPIESVLMLRQFLDDTLIPVRKKLQEIPCETLIGASGTFDSIIDIQLAKEGKKSRLEEIKTARKIDIPFFYELNKKLLKSGLQKRLNTPGMVAERAEMMVVACLLVEYVLREFDVKEIIQSEYAMKQGILWEVVNGGI